MSLAAFIAVAGIAIAVPPPAHVNRAEMLIRFPEIDATDLTEADRPALLAAASRLELVGPFDVVELSAGDACDAMALDVPALLELLRKLFSASHDAPPLADALRLPSSAACHAARDFCRGLARGWSLRADWEADRAGSLRAAAAEADRYADFWDAAGYAASEGGPWHNRRVSLAACRDLIGREAWAAGQLPDLAPFDLLTSRSR
ncbi:hypothetical protein J0H58_25420 [bacterium]|nr:hypothetical protein [bacterium]